MKHVPLKRFAFDAFEKVRTLTEAREASSTDFRIPNIRVFRKIIETAFWGSLHDEEARHQKFKFFYCELNQIEKVQNDAKKFGGYFQFKKRFEFSPEEVQKIAGTLNFSRTIVCLTKASPHKDTIVLHGLFHFGSTREKHFLHERREAVILPEFLVFSSNSPGRINIYLGDKGVLGFDRGKGIIGNLDLFTSSLLENEFDPQITEALDFIDKNLERKEPDRDRELKGVRRIYLGLIDNLTFQVFRRGHGGTLLFVPDDLSTEAAGELKFRNLLRCPDFWTDFLSLLQLGYSLYYKATNGEIPEKNLEIRTKEAYDKLHDYMDFVASLAQADGAVLLTKKMRIIGFGGEIRVDDKDMPVTFIKENDERKRRKIDPLKYGTRHRSSIRFCKRFPGAISLVFSQDGGVKAIKGGNDGVTILNEINRLRYDFFF